MFDPTIFDNLKVAFENYIYDMDNITGEIVVVNRIDQLDFAIMSRQFALEFSLVNQSLVTAEIVLTASAKDLASEILETNDHAAGCDLSLRFYTQVDDINTQCSQIENVLRDIWKREEPITQTISFIYDQNPPIQMNDIEINFNRKVNEEQIEEIPELIDYVLQSLDELNKITD